jgi:hypothetical protein
VREGRLLSIDMEELRRRTAEITSRLVAGAAGQPLQRY